MIFYQHKGEGAIEKYGWMPYHDDGHSDITPKLAKTFQFRINGTVYTEYSEELLEAHKADRIWDRLMYTQND